MPAIHIIPVLRDNYCYIIEGKDRHCIIVDPGQVVPLTSFISHNGFIPTLILNTHHHADHVAGNADLKQRYGIPVFGPAKESGLIPHMDKGFEDGQNFSECGFHFDVIETPGHTNGHIVFYAPELQALFAGDTLFSMGCGRLIEGSADDMFTSLQKLKLLPEETGIYCGHEYTEANGFFAQTIEPDNADIKTRLIDVSKLRANGQPTLPVTLALELKTNPFLRTNEAKKFAELRLRKDQF